MPYGQIWLGLTPGALEGMGVLGIAPGYDTAFVAAHHVLRLLMLTLAIPTVVVIIKRRESAAIGS
ncbi:MAG: AbrB family transcriptional regulator [Candidatus Devosia euplotis]|nr:AbrB family transcriptional regulator [Candidatus Devosia euplotis]